ncbi:MAG TPA: redoxin domain-containing protein [Solirubrobacteraceae bacterium]|nr:redoxin domain-containing protein [Solirubrobacteraceae bacterium]
MKSVSGDNGSVTVETLPQLELASVDGSPVRFGDVLAGGVSVVLFVTEECPTCAMTLRRLAAPGGDLAAAGISAIAIFEDPLEVAARTARAAGFPGTVLSEPEPYELSRSFELQSVPTTMLFDSEGRVLRRVVGWDREGLDDLLAQASALAGAPAPQVTGEAPHRKPGCAAKSTYDSETLALINASGPHDELEDMFERGWSDGLPVIPPTRARVDAMLGGRDPSISLGEVPPALGEATLERVASCAVLAGCRPDYFPVVLAAAQAMLEPAFNLNGQAVTTQPVGQLVILNGPARHSLGLNSSIGALGPGHRANLTIGRALRLLISLTGGGFPGRLDRATLGHAGKLGFCLAENEEVSPWEPLAVERGFAADSSVVTVVGCDAPLSISDHRSRTPEELARVLALAAAATWSPNWWPLGGTSLFVICPEHAHLFGEAEWSKRRLREEMFEAACRPAGELRWGETTPLVQAAPDDRPISKWTSAEDIVVVVAGGEAGRYSAVFGPCLGLQAEIVSKEVP